MATRPHSTGASTPPWRMHREYLSVNHRQSEDLGDHRRLGHVQGRPHVQAGHKGSVVSEPPLLQINTSVFLPLTVPLQYVRQQSLHVFTIDTSFGSNVQAFPFNRLLFIVEHIHQHSRIPFGEHAQSRGTHEGPSQAWRQALCSVAFYLVPAEPCPP